MIRQALGFLCCAMMLFVVGAQAQPTQHTFEEAERVLDHFLCYMANDPNILPPEGILLKDQFSNDPERAIIASREYLCNPADKDDRKRQHPNSHLVCYLVEGVKTPPQVRVANQLHPNQLLWLRRATLLCLPTGKEEIKEGQPRSSTPPKIPDDIDHFKCYPQSRERGISPPGLRRQHTFTDQFASYRLNYFAAWYLCNPAVKYKGGRLEKTVLHDFAHLVCYETNPGFTGIRKVRIANQFEPDATVTVGHMEMACFPSTKSVRR